MTRPTTYFGWSSSPVQDHHFYGKSRRVQGMEAKAPKHTSRYNLSETEKKTLGHLTSLSGWVNRANDKQ